MKKNVLIQAVAVVLSAMMCTSLSACGSSATQQEIAKPRIGISQETSRFQFSRVKLYSSLQEMADDSSHIVAGIVTSQKVEEDVAAPGTHVTLSKFRIMDSLKGDKKPGEEITILQDGERDPMILKENEVVLLFLDAMYTGDARDLPWKGQYAVSGVWAGIYSLSNINEFTTLASIESNNSDRGTNEEDVNFSRFMVSPSDQLPETISLSAVRDLQK